MADVVVDIEAISSNITLLNTLFDELESGVQTVNLNRHGFRAVFMRAAAPGGGQWLQRSGCLRPRSG